jgi:hypothetical protein
VLDERSLYTTQGRCYQLASAYYFNLSRLEMIHFLALIQSKEENSFWGSVFRDRFLLSSTFWMIVE